MIIQKRQRLATKPQKTLFRPNRHQKIKMDGLMNLESYMNSTSQERRKKAMEIRSPWSSGSGSTSPLPTRLSLFDKSYSGADMGQGLPDFEN